MAHRAETSMLTFAPMIDSELSRLVLAYHDENFCEERHIFGWASILALLRGFSLQIPLLSREGIRMVGPRALSDHLDTLCPADQMLVPSTQPLNSQIEEDWLRFNGDLGSATAVFAYFHLLPHRDVMFEPFTIGLPRYEKIALRFLYPAQRFLLSVLLRLTAARADDALLHIRMIVSRVDLRVADGRQFLFGDRLTLADLSLASSLAPLLLPEGYGAPMPPLEKMPEALGKVIVDLRKSKTAQFAQRVYSKIYRS